MKSSRLALRITLHSVIMILAVYIVMQSLVFLRDNILLGIGDFSGLPAAVFGFIGGSVLPPMIIFAILIFLVGLRLQRVEEQLDRGDVLPPETLELTRKRILGFSTLVTAVNLIGFTLGYILSQILSGKASELLAPSGLLILVSNLAGSFAYAYAQSALNNLAFANLREKLGIREIGQRKREMSNTTRQVLLTVSLSIYILTMVQMNVFDIARASELETKIFDQIRSGQIAPDAAAAEYRKLLGSESYIFSTRKNLEVEKVPLPWERGTSLSTIELAVFLLFGLFSFVICAGIQIAWSTDLRRQLHALSQRLRDVVAGGGDLRRRINLRTMDDIGEITELVNHMLDQFQGVVRRIGAAAHETQSTSQAIGQVLSSSEKVAQQSAQAFISLKSSLEIQAAESLKLTTALGSFDAAVQGVDAAAENQRRYVTETSAAMEEMASNIESVEAMTRKSQVLTEQLAEQGRSGGQAVSETATAISGIEESAKQVLEVLGALNRIAASTNLLAMNAAIEAAHAGVHGAGFAVVADEVRQLANSASSQTKAIRDLIKTMSERVNRGVNTVGTSAKALGSLVTGLQTAATISDEIASAMKEQSIGTRSSADSLLQIVDASKTIHERTGDQTAQTRQMSDTLDDNIQRLNQLVHEARQQTEKIAALEQSFAAVRQEVTRNSQAVNQLNVEIERFQVD